MVLIAEILKYFYPRSVDLHNYSAVNSKSAKAKNWETLNKKVLKRLKIPISNDMISDLSSAVPGAAEELLQKIKDKVEAVDMSSESVTSFDSSRDENAPSYEEISQALQDCQQQITEKEEVINSLKADVVHVRGLLKLKEQHIADLTAQLKRLQEKCSDEIKGNNEILSFI
ncbi:sperm flagellar protein 1-like isoform X2 [Ischnura elegans]|uniref:sperm flagellar protein 1-like isoform X2 n=1 Tax=Ischnura elegans TaxID=197161 RepID=UPI001ED8BD7D|nr:sperm flagellar protein 1-like isoform X2 [Ischnura elegans]